MNRLIQLAAFSPPPRHSRARSSLLRPACPSQASRQESEAAARERRMALAVHCLPTPTRRAKRTTSFRTRTSAHSSTSSSPPLQTSGASRSTASTSSLARDGPRATSPFPARSSPTRTATSSISRPRRPLRTLARLTLGRPQRQAAPRRLRRPRLDQAGPPHHRPRRRVHPLGRFPDEPLPSHPEAAQHPPPALMKDLARWAAEPLPGSGIIQNITHAILVDPDGTPHEVAPSALGIAPPPRTQVRHRHQRSGAQTTKLTTEN